MASHRGMLSIILLLITSCATTGERSRSPDRLAGIMLESICAALNAEDGMTSHRNITVPHETVPLYEIAALHVLSSPRALTIDEFNYDDELSENLRETFEPVPIVPPEAPSECSWNITDSIRRARIRNNLVLELSSPVRNPYAASPSRNLGVFARVTVGILGGSWYWIVLEKKDDRWNAVEIIRLDISEA